MVSPVTLPTPSRRTTRLPTLRYSGWISFSRTLISCAISPLLLLPSFRRVHHGLVDFRVAGAAAEAPSEPFSHLFDRRRRVAVAERLRTHDHSARSAAALYAPAVHDHL